MVHFGYIFWEGSVQRFILVQFLMMDGLEGMYSTEVKVDFGPFLFFKDWFKFEMKYVL